MFVSVDGKAKKVTEIFAGGSDGKAHKITEAFGSVDGVAKRIFNIEEKEPNAFDQFTWAEIKQLATDGQLLEHFNLYDKVTIVFKEPLTSTFKNIPQCQTEMLLQIVELTENKMRLMSPRVPVVTGKFYLPEWAVNSNALDAWGYSTGYTALKAIDNALPDDFRDVLSAYKKVRIGTKSTIEGTVTVYDTDLRVSQISDDVFNVTFDKTNPEIYYPIIESYYPTKVLDFTYYLNLPPEENNYEGRKNWIKNYFGTVYFLDFSTVETIYGDEGRHSWIRSPYYSSLYTKGVTTTAQYNELKSVEKVRGAQSTSGAHSLIVPEMIIQG